MPITTPPTFNPPAYAIAVGTLGFVLTSNGPGNKPTFKAPASGGGFYPGFVSQAIAAGATNNLAPAGFPGTTAAPITRLDIDPSAGASNITGLLAGNDGQAVFIFNPDAVNSLTLNNQNVGSAAANRFQGSGDFVLVPQNGILIIYYAGAINRWRFAP